MASLPQAMLSANGPEVRLMRQMTCVNIFNEVNLHEWTHNRLSVLMSTHLGMSGKYFFEVA